MVVEFEHVRPGADIFAGRGELGHVAGEKLQRLGVTVRPATFLKIAPLLDFPGRAFGLRVGVDPVEDFAVAFAFLQFGQQLFGVNARVVEDVLVQRAIEMKLAIFADDGRTAFVEHAWQQRITAKAAARTARWTLREIGCGDVDGFAHIIFLIFFVVLNGQFKSSQSAADIESFASDP